MSTNLKFKISQVRQGHLKKNNYLHCTVLVLYNLKFSSIFSVNNAHKASHNVEYSYVLTSTMLFVLYYVDNLSKKSFLKVKGLEMPQWLGIFCWQRTGNPVSWQQTGNLLEIYPRNGSGFEEEGGGSYSVPNGLKITNLKRNIQTKA